MPFKRYTLYTQGTRGTTPEFIICIILFVQIFIESNYAIP